MLNRLGKVLLWSGCIAGAFTNTASACEDGHWITEVSSNGAVVILEDRSVWEVSPTDRIDSQLWLSTENVVACDDKLINTDEGEVVEASKLN
jgi:hypothetical protein